MRRRKGFPMWVKVLGSGALLTVLVTVLAINSAPSQRSGSPTNEPAARAGASQSAPTPTPTPTDRPLVFTYFYYWYDATTGAHLRSEHGLTHHLPPEPQPSWRNVAWFKKELADMRQAGIDVVLPVFWGHDRPDDEWSVDGLPNLAQAWRELAAEGQQPPAIGLFFDTAIIDMRDLTTPEGMEYFYSNFKEFFIRIPREQWALIDGRPVAFLFTSDVTGPFSQATFDHVYQRFETDFGVRPYIVREVSWDYPTLRWQNGERVRDYGSPIRTENSYIWAASIFGYVDRGGVATVGPGYDDRGVPGRNRRPTERNGGEFYRRAFEAAITSGKPLLAIETWNEIHEGSGISETVEFGRQYIHLTRELTDRFRAAHGQRG